MDLNLTLDPRLGKRTALETALRTAIHDGHLTVGRAVPSSRSLAADLDVSRATVVAAYEQLIAEGFLVAEHGRATLVADIHVPETPAESGHPFGDPPAHDFRPGEPDPSAFPRRAWLRSVRRVLSDAPDDVFGYSDPRGRAELRISLSHYLGRARNVRADPQSIAIVSGFATALGFIGDLFRARGCGRVAVEDPMLFFHRDILRNAGIEVVPVPVDHEGICVDLLPVDVDAVLVTPAHQHPTGVTMSPERRGALVSWAHECDAWIIEDDYDGEFRYDRRPIGALQALAPDRVLHAGTASKALAPGLRMAWLTVPPVLRRPLFETIHARGGVSTVDQLILADFIDRGELDRQVRAMRRRYERRRDELCARLDGEIRWLDIVDNRAGLHLVAHLGDPAIERNVTEQLVQRQAEIDSVGLLPLGLFHADGVAPRPGITLGFSRPPEHHWANALDALVDTLRSFS